MAYFLKYFLPGLGLLVLALIAGSQKSFAFGFLGFICFFMVGILLIVEGYKKKKKGDL